MRVKILACQCYWKKIGSLILRGGQKTSLAACSAISDSHGPKKVLLLKAISPFWNRASTDPGPDTVDIEKDVTVLAGSSAKAFLPTL